MRHALALAITLLVLGCGSKDNVALSGSVDAVQLMKRDATLGTTVSGSCELRLELGEHAPAAVEVALEQFSLVLDSDERELTSLVVEPPSASFPVGLEAGEELRIELRVEDAALSADDVPLVCGGVRIVGAVTDTADGRTTRVESGAVIPGGC
jgi:hypothetical protein